jgi:hypothetical protein
MEEMKPRVVGEVVKAAREWLGPDSERVLSAFA